MLLLQRLRTALHFYGGRGPANDAPGELAARARARAAQVLDERDRAFSNGCRACGRKIPAGEACLIFRWATGRLQVECIECPAGAH